MKNSENSNVEKTRRHSSCIFQSIVTRRVISKHIWNIKGLCPFEKSIHFREKYTMKRPRMKGWKVWGILKSRFILEKYTQWSAHKWRVGRFAAFWKFIHFREKYKMKLPQMKGRTLCGILKNWFILETNTLWNAHEWRVGRFAGFWKIDSF